MSQKEDFSRKSAEERKGISAEAQKLSQMLSEATHAVFFGGAGVSCESGIPDFRSDTCSDFPVADISEKKRFYQFCRNGYRLTDA